MGVGEDGEDERAKVQQAAGRDRLDHPRGCGQSQLSSEAPNTGHSGAQGAAACAGAAGSGSELCKPPFWVPVHTVTVPGKTLEMDCRPCSKFRSLGKGECVSGPRVTLCRRRPWWYRCVWG